MIDEQIEELISIGASVAANCHPCIKFHTDKAAKLNIDTDDIKAAMAIGQKVRTGAASQVDKLLAEII
ncbi:MAG: carboxymuconolactone decarboxylase family protein [Planctomycetota bacterium]|jgi:AhpD family alkylhydroperoxidase